eukprot:scaffold9706_cov79-Skeletonema_dohrnii-CCMP3373.AAC.8
MLRYLGSRICVQSKTGQDETMWKEIGSWLTNQRAFLGNSTDTIVESLSDLVQKIPLTAETYTKATVLEQSTRECIALFLWTACKSKSSLPPQPRQRQRRQATAAVSTKGTAKRESPKCARNRQRVKAHTRLAERRKTSSRLYVQASDSLRPTPLPARGPCHRHWLC